MPPPAAGKRVFFFPDSAARDSAGAVPGPRMRDDPLEVGTPYLHRRPSGAGTGAAAAGPVLSEGQDVDRQLDRCRAARPT
jgi:light-independent protochlorophyllide reductase subunit N